MRTIVFLLMGLLCLWQPAVSQNTYYYADGRKIYLQEDKSSVILEFQEGYSPGTALKTTVSSAKVDLHERQGRAVLQLKNRTSGSVGQLINDLSIHRASIKNASFGYKVGELSLWPTSKVVLRLKEGVNMYQLIPLLKQYGGSYSKNRFNTLVLQVKDIAHALPLANSLEESGLVKWAHPDFFVPVQRYNDPLYPQQFQMNNTGQAIDAIGGVNNMDCDAPEAWGITQGASTIKVAVIDDGVENHEDLLDVLPGYTPVTEGNGAPRLMTDAHGQSVSGIIAARHNSIGVRGLAPNVRIMPVNIFYGGETIQDLADAFTWAKNNGADVISNSWAWSSCTISFSTLTDAIADARVNGRGGKGCVITFAAGNDYSSCVSYPGNLPTVIAVGAFTNKGQKSSYSNTGAALDISAPSNDVNGSGAGVRTIDRMGVPGYNTSNYTNTFGGTSAACPVVSGVAALVLSVNPALTVSQVENILYATAVDMGTPGRDDSFGFGRVNAYGAVQAALIVNSNPPIGKTIALKAVVNNKYVAAENAGNNPLIANRDGIGPWEQFVVEDAGNGFIALRAIVNNKYVVAENIGTQALIANRDGIGAWERFRWIDNDDGTFALFALANSRYVVAENAGTQPLIANRTGVGLWERFTFTEITFQPPNPVPAPIGRIIALKAIVNNKYVVAENAGTGLLIANRDGIGFWEQFVVEDAGDGFIALRAIVNNKYVVAENAGTQALIANRDAIGPWEKFVWSGNEDGTISLFAYVNNRYVAAENAGSEPLIANRTGVGLWERFTYTLMDRNQAARQTPAASMNSQAAIQIVPNPSSDFIKIMAGTSEVPYEMYSTQGMKVRTGKIRGSQLIDIRSLPSGLYLISLPSGLYRFMKE